MKKKENNNLRLSQEKKAIKEIKYHFSLISKILLILTSIFWILPFIIINLVLGKYIRNGLEDFPRQGPVPNSKYSGINFNTLAFYNRDMKLKNAPNSLFINEKTWNAIEKEDVLINTFDKTTLATFLLIAKKPTNKWIVVLHGWMQNRYSILYLAKHFYEAGFNVLVYDARSHGVNAKTSCTLGFNEAKDLFFILKYLKERYQNQTIEVSLIGNSMGATTLLQGLVTYDLPALGLKSAIFDCGFDNLAHMIKILGQTRTKCHWFWFFYGVKFWFHVKDKFDVNAVKPIKKMQNCAKIPILFIHGTLDQTVPITMTERLYQAKIKNTDEIHHNGESFSKLLLVKNARHTEAIIKDYKLYSSTTLTFVKQWFNQTKE